ncbi:hypothetical protein TREES_T100007478 [Tupaia chinensis]|uniref:Uncharacterized protein n=1 Tax=Tupaia chinensis TaxID=246437 RepID=L9L4M0_TUPCH|nr:hypothetical protein TREES_T100007478 [Tupaia chinensis]
MTLDGRSSQGKAVDASVPLEQHFFDQGPTISMIASVQSLVTTTAVIAAITATCTTIAAATYHHSPAP